MAKTFEYHDVIQAPPEKIFEAMTDPAWYEEWTRVQGGQNPRMRVESKTDTSAYVVLDLEEGLPKPFGTIKAQMTFSWELPRHFCTWKRSGEGIGGKARVEGSTELKDLGNGTTEFIEKGTVDVPVPMVGKKLEAGVIEHLGKTRPEKLRFLKERVEG